MAYYVKDITWTKYTRFVIIRKTRFETLKSRNKLHINPKSGIKTITLPATFNEYEAFNRERGIKV